MDIGYDRMFAESRWVRPLDRQTCAVRFTDSVRFWDWSRERLQGAGIGEHKTTTVGCLIGFADELAG